MTPTPPPLPSDAVRDLVQSSYDAVERIGVASAALILILIMGFAILFVLVSPLIRVWQARIKDEADDRKGERELRERQSKDEAEDRKGERDLRERQLKATEHIAEVVATNTEVLREARDAHRQQIEKLTTYTLIVDKTANAIVGKIDTLHLTADNNGEKLDRVIGALANVSSILANVNVQLKSLLREIDDHQPKAETFTSVINNAVALPENINPS